MKFKSVISSVAMALFWHFYFAYKFFSAWWVPYNSETIKFRDVLDAGVVHQKTENETFPFQRGNMFF